VNWLGLFALGGATGVDATSCMQVMLSRPLVAGALTGAMLGEPGAGATMGAVLEAFQLALLPVGASRYPETGTATVAATAAYVAVATAALDPPALLLALLFGLAWGRATGWSVFWTRRLNERLIARALAAASAARGIERGHAAAMIVDFVRGGAVTVIGAALGTLLLRPLVPLWAFPPELALAALTAAVAAVLAATLDLFGGWRERRLLFLAGLLFGSLLVVFT
jgi:mannose/fructose/N-acetylgalactosamine-specific phosphotransferase system component IIC